MTSRSEIDAIVRELYAARVSGDLERVFRLFSGNARFEIASASRGNPVAVHSSGIGEFRPLLTLLIKTFRITDQSFLSIIMDGPKAAVHWQAKVHSRITGTAVLTEFIDLIEVQDGLIASYLEFFVPR
jgi:ketosteroid isomerase-like protein